MTQKFEIWLAKVQFSEIDGEKERPVLILDWIRKEVLCLRMTSKLPQTADDFEIRYWQEAGLHKQTVINTAKRLKLKEDKLITRIGKLHDDDIILLKIRHQIT